MQSILSILARDREVGSKCDALDTVKKWYTAHVVSASEKTVTVKYDGWDDDYYNENLQRTSNRLVRLPTSYNIDRNLASLLSRRLT